jgi:hypothetical protein
MIGLLNKIIRTRREEQGAAIIFSVMGSLVVLALAYMLMLSTTQNLTVAFFTNNDSKLNAINETGISMATTLINSGYDYKQHNSENPYVSEKQVFTDGVFRTVEKFEWYAEPFDIADTQFCTGELSQHVPGSMEVLVVGGGGSGGGSIGGGGGAGGFIETTTVVQAGEHQVFVGAGGVAALPQEAGNAGQDSSIFGFTALGGGGGGAVVADNTVLPPTSGGSGGGATASTTTVSPQSGGLGAAGQGTRGGDSIATTPTSPAGSGGGGAGTSGFQASNSVGGNGGDGLASLITGVQTFYASGGGGAAESGSGTSGAGGNGGGGSGGLGEAPGGDALPNTGSGGGGAYGFVNNLSGAGASGIVIVRYPTEIDGISTKTTATGGSVEEITVGTTKYNVHSFTTAGEDTFNLITTGANKYNCGLNLYVTSSMPYYSANAKLVTKTILTPFEYENAAINSNVISYLPVKTSLFRSGIHALGTLTIDQGASLYSHYGNDDLASSGTVLGTSSSLNAASLGAQTNVVINSTNVSAADLLTISLFHASGSNPASYTHAGCTISSVECPRVLINKQNFKINPTAHNNWMSETCTNVLNSFTSTQIIPAGVTCVTASSISLGNNPVFGTYDNPSILIVNGNVNFVQNANLNIDRSPRNLQIYVTGSIANTPAENSTSNINALLAATGTGSNISLQELNMNSSVNFSGSMFASNNITLSGNLNIWHDLNTKFINNPEATMVYQRSSTDNITYVPEPFNIANLGTAFGEQWTPDTSQGNANPQNGGGQ